MILKIFCDKIKRYCELTTRKGEMYMLAASFLKMLAFYAVEFLVIAAVAVAGFLIGKGLKDKKIKKNAEKAD